MAAGSFDDVLAITGFSTCLGIAFSTGQRCSSVVSCSGSLLFSTCSVCSFRFYMDEHPQRSAGGGGRDSSRTGPGSVPGPFPKQ